MTHGDKCNTKSLVGLDTFPHMTMKMCFFKRIKKLSLSLSLVRFPVIYCRCVYNNKGKKKYTKKMHLNINCSIILKITMMTTLLPVSLQHIKSHVIVLPICSPAAGCVTRSQRFSNFQVVA